MYSNSIFQSCLSFFVLFILLTHVSGQEVVSLKNAPTSVLKLYQKAEKQIRKKDYPKAICFLEKAIKKEALFIDGILKIGGLYYEKSNFQQAKEYFLRAIELDSTYDYRALQALSLSLEKNKEYQEAAYFLKKYRSQPNLSEEGMRKTDRKIKTLEFIATSRANPTLIDIQKLGSTVNTSNFENWPSLTADGNTMFFTRLTENQEDLYYTQKDSLGQWSDAKMMPNINTYENEGAHCTSADGKIVLFTYCSDGRAGQAKGCNIYISRKRGETWSSPVYFNEINSSAWDSQPNISGDGKTIIFSSTRKGGKGKADLWISTIGTDGKWGAPKNLGDVINTRGDDGAPFFHPDGKTLYFMSDHHIGLGSNDLFYTKMGENNKWRKPVNLGFPINGEYHEGAMVVSLDGKTAYFSRGNLAENAQRNDLDIYTFELPPESRAHPMGFVKINVKDAVTLEALVSNVEIQSTDESSDTKSQFMTDEEGSILIPLEIGKNHSFNVNKSGYYFKSERIELSEPLLVEDAYELELLLDPIAPSVAIVEKPVVLKNVLFETGSYALLESSGFELGKLVELLDNNLKLKIEIRGHTDNVGEGSDNDILSEQRAKAIFTYLIGRGISADRLSYKGFGEKKPIDTNETVQGRKNNRRTEFVIKN